MTTALRLRNWDKWQTYRKDRGTPPWIKVHRGLMGNPDWAVLTDAEKGQLVSIWIIGAEKGGIIPSDTRILRKVCMLDDEPNINKFIDLGFIENPDFHDGEGLTSSGCHGDANMTINRHQVDAPETETETETENICSTPAKKKSPTGYTPEFEAAWSAYPKREGGDSKADAFKAWNARLKQKHTAVQLMGGVQRYATYCKLKSIEGTEFVKRAATFFGPGNHFTQSWEVISGARQQPGRQSTPSMQRDQTHRDAYRELAGASESEAGPEGGGGDFRKDAAPVGSAMDGEDWGDKGGDPGPGE